MAAAWRDAWNSATRLLQGPVAWRALGSWRSVSTFWRRRVVLPRADRLGAVDPSAFDHARSSVDRVRMPAGRATGSRGVGCGEHGRSQLSLASSYRSSCSVLRSACSGGTFPLLRLPVFSQDGPSPSSLGWPATVRRERRQGPCFRVGLFRGARGATWTSDHQSPPCRRSEEQWSPMGDTS